MHTPSAEVQTDPPVNFTVSEPADDPVGVVQTEAARHSTAMPVQELVLVQLVPVTVSVEIPEKVGEEP